MQTSLEKFKDSQFIGVKELADTATEILKAVGPEQEKKTVTEFPNERTVRYYVTEGLITPPDEKQGQASVFRYEHLVALLVIKKLQADGLPISVIRSLITGRRAEELEKLLGEEVRVFTDASELDEYRRAAGHTDDSDVVVIDDPSARREYLENAPQKNEAKEFLESLLLRTPSRQSEDRKILFSRPAAQPKPAGEIWRRYEIAPGIELNIARRNKSPLDDRERQEVLQMIDRILRSRK